MAPGMIGHRAPLDDRFVNNVQINGPLVLFELGPCHVWTGCIHESGFGVIRLGHRFFYVHRLAWERAYGAVPQGRIEQICHNRLCVRVDHLRQTK